jgi:hypothetical protein
MPVDHLLAHHLGNVGRFDLDWQVVQRGGLLCRARLG